MESKAPATKGDLSVASLVSVASDISSTTNGSSMACCGKKRSGKKPKIRPGKGVTKQHVKKSRLNPANLFLEMAMCELTNGLEERVEKLLRLAYLRLLTPSFMPQGTTPEGAFRRFLELEPSLLKCRHEQEVFAAAATVAKKLKPHGVQRIRDLLPLENKAAPLFEEMGLDVTLLAVCSNIIEELKPMTMVHRYGRVGRREMANENIRRCPDGCCCCAWWWCGGDGCGIRDMWARAIGRQDFILAPILLNLMKCSHLWVVLNAARL